MILRILRRRRRFGLEVMLRGVYEFTIYIYKYIETKFNIYIYI